MVLIKGKLYDVLKFFALIALPAFGTLYFTLAAIWGLPAAQEVVNTVLAVDTFLGVILQLSSTAYSKGVEEGGELHINDGQLLFEVDEDKVDLEKIKQGGTDEVRFKVKKNRKHKAPE